MKRTVTIPMLIGPGGYYYAYGHGDKKGAGEVDSAWMWDCTDGWSVPETSIQRVNVEVLVDFPDESPQTVKGTVVADSEASAPTSDH